MSHLNDPCPFCDVSDRAILGQSEHAFAMHDAFPVSQGHTLVIPRCHVADLFDLPECELVEVFALVGRMKNELLAEFSPAGFNIGINIGRDAGQTVKHAHVHIIPRYPSDVADPTGGVRNVIPGKGPYTRTIE
ncbi:MAG: HIT family protein [Planctomycetes bacterium]|nr:HIT family protein [Planctomycetota bacterium]MBL7041319.1 HIT family protein [Pirellulaceae bacterium]